MTTATVTRTNPELWESIKREMMATTCNRKWSARCAQLCVLEYKRRGGGYIGRKPTKDENSLVKWTEEKWQYAGTPKKSRYLPQKVRNALPDDLKKKQNEKKGSRLGQNVPYSQQLNDLMKRYHIY